MFKTLTDFFVYRYRIKIHPYLKWYLLGLFFMVSIASFFVPADIFSKDLKVYFLDIGQGDAALVRTPQRQNILIDGGPDNSIVYKLGKYLPFWERKIDLVILSHPHADHLVGLVEVLKRYKVERVIFTGVSYYSDSYSEFKKLREEKQIPFTLALAGREFNFPPLGGGNGGVKITILYPFENLWNKVFYGDPEDGGGLNDTSVVVGMGFGENYFLFMGDAGVEVEKEILRNFQSRIPNPETSPTPSLPLKKGEGKGGGQNSTTNNYQLKSKILKVGHHGSDTASSYEFLKEVSPNLAIISVGKNKYGHPAYRILYRLRDLGIPFLRTDESGDIKIRCGLEKCVIF